jgi:YfiH family protein
LTGLNVPAAPPSSSSSWLSPDWPELPANVGALFTTRRGGVSVAPYDDGFGGGGLNLGVHVGDQPGCVAFNRGLLRAALPAEPAWLTQVHGTTVFDVTAHAGFAAAAAAAAEGAAGVSQADPLVASAPAVPGAATQEAHANFAPPWAEGQLAVPRTDPAPAAPEADASLAHAPGSVCVIMTADCLPVLFCDRAGKVVAAAHAGWRGLANGVLARTVAGMRAAGAGEILAWLGPAIGPARFEVGAEVKQTFLEQGSAADAARLTAAFTPLPGHPGKYLADIYALARCMLEADGVSRIAGGELCTVSDVANFYSYRRDGVTGRQASLIWIK